MNIKKEFNKVSDKVSGTDNTKVVVALLAGVAIGALVGLLLAPDSGAEIRSSLSNSIKDLGATIADKAKAGKDKVSDLTGQAVDAVKNKVNGAAQDVEKSSFI